MNGTLNMGNHILNKSTHNQLVDLTWKIHVKLGKFKTPSGSPLTFTPWQIRPTQQYAVNSTRLRLKRHSSRPSISEHAARG